MKKQFIILSILLASVTISFLCSIHANRTAQAEYKKMTVACTNSSDEVRSMLKDLEEGIKEEGEAGSDKNGL